MSIIIPPAFYQTYWFLALCFLALAGLIWLLYLARVRRIAALYQGRMEERIHERVRIARDLHDTLLQTIQASKMVAASAVMNATDHAHTVQALEKLSSWLGQATEEGRAALNSLRASATEMNDLAEAFCQAIDECRRESSIDILFSLRGDSKKMHPV